jgi:hypothetical protein
MSYELPKIDIKALILTIVLVTGAVAFCGGALANADPLWFLPYSNLTPTHIVVHQNGCDVTLLPGQNGFEEMTAALNQSLSQIDGYESGFGLTVESLSDYRKKDRAVEAYFDSRSRFMSRSGWRADQHTHPDRQATLRTRARSSGRDGDYWAGAAAQTTEPVRRAMEQVRCE